jgi:hypothetical protein
MKMKSTKVGFLKNFGSSFFGAIGNEVAMKLDEPELIYRLLRNKNSKTTKIRQQPIQRPVKLLIPLSTNRYY